MGSENETNDVGNGTGGRELGRDDTDMRIARPGVPAGSVCGRRAPESEGLEPLVGDGYVIGQHDDINGPGAELVVGFTPTRAELRTLAYHYLDRFFAVEAVFATGDSGSFEIRESPFAWGRFSAIAFALNPDGPIAEFEEYIAKRTAEVAEYGRQYRAMRREPTPTDAQESKG